MELCQWRPVLTLAASLTSFSWHLSQPVVHMPAHTLPSPHRGCTSSVRVCLALQLTCLLTCCGSICLCQVKNLTIYSAAPARGQLPQDSWLTFLATALSKSDELRRQLNMSVIKDPSNCCPGIFTYIMQIVWPGLEVGGWHWLCVHLTEIWMISC